jgi:hypothetical protein
LGGWWLFRKDKTPNGRKVDQIKVKKGKYCSRIFAEKTEGAWEEYGYLLNF